MNTTSKKMTPFAYLSPTLLLLTVLSLVPIVMVFYYSMMDNVIMNQNPVFVGISNYVEIVSDSVFHQALWQYVILDGHERYCSPYSWLVVSPCS